MERYIIRRERKKKYKQDRREIKINTPTIEVVVALFFILVLFSSAFADDCG